YQQEVDQRHRAHSGEARFRPAPEYGQILHFIEFHYLDKLHVCALIRPAQTSEWIRQIPNSPGEVFGSAFLQVLDARLILAPAGRVKVRLVPERFVVLETSMGGVLPELLDDEDEEDEEDEEDDEREEEQETRFPR
ncbi:hypothetical protein QFC22_006698, partial [Naganishia vaughanmartiniae]